MNFALIFLLIRGALLLNSAVDAKLQGGSHGIDLSQQGLFQGDIEIPKRQSRNGILRTQRWPNNTIYYAYGAKWDQDQIEKLQYAMDEIQEETCIKFVKRTNQPNYINIINGTRCSSPVGYLGSGVQNVSLRHSESGGDCWSLKNIFHELLHTVGLWHEQSRYDRDDYISVNLANVDYCNRYNFDIEPSSSSNTYGVAYNYLSIMHYRSTAFSSNGGITMTTKDPSFMDEIGQQDQAASSDYDKVKRIYQCGDYQNFVVPPVKLPTSASTSSAGGCVSVDCSEECPSLAATNNCQTDPDFMNKFCTKSCNTCSAAAKRILTATACDDTETDCATLAADGYCQKDGWADYMTRSCPKSCGACSGTSSQRLGQH